MTSIAHDLARWAADLDPTADDLALAGRALRDTVAVAVAAREHPVVATSAGLPDAARWAVAGHVLDFDDLHMRSTTHVSVVCVPAVLAAGGGARASGPSTPSRSWWGRASTPGRSTGSYCGPRPAR